MSKAIKQATMSEFDLQKKIALIRLSMRTSPQKDSNEMKKLKKEIAKLKTEQK